MVSYFSVKELSTMGLFALLSSLINFTFPIKHITEIFNIPGPASGMCIFGGIIFVFWICLAHRIIKKRYSAILTSVFISAFCLFFSPWYGVVSPYWFGIFGVIALVAVGISVESIRYPINGGIGNMLALSLTWIALAKYAKVYPPANLIPLLLVVSFLSGYLGAYLSLKFGELKWKRM